MKNSALSEQTGYYFGGAGNDASRRKIVVGGVSGSVYKADIELLFKLALTTTRLIIAGDIKNYSPMKVSLLYYLSIVTCFLSCHQEEALVKPSADINQFVNSQAHLPEAAPDGTTLIADQPSFPQIVDGSGYTVHKRTFRATKQFTSHINAKGFDQADPGTSQGLYVGSVVRLKAFGQRGDLTPVGITARTPVKLTSDLPGTMSMELQPEKAAYQAVINQWHQQATGVTANIYYDATTLNTTEQALLAQGINIGWGPVSFASRFSSSTDLQQQDVVIAFRQVYHTVTMNPLGSAADYFSASIDMSSLKAATSFDDPLGYVSEITYGRLLLAKLHFKTSINSDKQQLSTSIKSALSLGVTSSTELKKTLSEASVKLTVLGGDASIAIESSNGYDAINKINEWIKSGANSPAKGVPISYKVRYLSDNSLVTLGASTEYDDYSEARLVKPSKFFIKKLTITQLPLLDPSGNYWDSGLVGLPDVFFTITDLKGTNLYALDPFQRKENASDEQLKQGLISWILTEANMPFNATTPIKISVWDYDSIGSNEFMGEVRFDSTNVFPQDQIELTSTDGKLKLVLALGWQ